jgi:hypothetical protein
VSLKGVALKGTPSFQPTSVTTTNNPKPGQQQDLSTPNAATNASTPLAIIDDVLATKTPSPQDLLKDETEKTTNNRPHSLTRFPRIIASNADATKGEAGCLPAESEPISLSRGAPTSAKNFSNSTPSGESVQASTSGTVHTHAAETCIGNTQQETSVTIAAKTPNPQDLTKDPWARRPRTTSPTTTTSVIIDTKTPNPQDLLKDATARRPRTKTPKTTTPCKRVFITNVKGTFFGMSESEEASKRR